MIVLLKCTYDDLVRTYELLASLESIILTKWLIL